MENTETENRHGLKRTLSAVSVWALAFGCLIGWGSFIMPGMTFLKRAGPLGSMFAIEIAAFIMLNISYNYYYMLDKFPEDGGQFLYASRAFGRIHGFFCAWFLGLCYMCIIPLNATALQIMARTLFDDALQFGFHYVVAGYDVYLGEVLLAAVVLVSLALICSLSIRAVGKIQTLLVVFEIIAIIIILIGSVINPGKVLHDNLGPLFHPTLEQNGLVQMLSVIAVAPWAFVGFEIVPQVSRESNFSRTAGKVIMDICIFVGAFFYISMTLMAALSIPIGYPTWVEYIHGLPFLRGIASVPTSFAAFRMMGNAGLFLWNLAAVSAALTSIIGFYIATSRMLYTMAERDIIPSWFGKLNRFNVPLNATLFCMAVSMIAPFFGRNVLSWAVDMSSLGAAIGFGYTSLAAWKYAKEDRRTDIRIFGAVGFVCSAVFALLLLIPIPILDCSMGKESWVCFFIWGLLGWVFFARHSHKKMPSPEPEAEREGHVHHSLFKWFRVK